MTSKRQTFVLVHGAWHGGWCWGPVADNLRAASHRVSTPTMTGLGERSHLLSIDITIKTMVDDIVAHIIYEDLREVRLVGHSFGGPIISGVADRVGERLADLTFLDSLWLEDGMAAIDLLSPEVGAARLGASQAFDGGLSFPVPPPAAFGVKNDAGAAFLEGRVKPHPTRTYTEPLNLSGSPTSGLPARYVVCTEPLYAPVAGSREAAREAGLEMVDLAAPHDCMVTHPMETAEVLLK